MQPRSPKLLEDIRDAAAFIREVAKGTLRVQAALGQSVLSRVITELSENPGVASWVSVGGAPPSIGA